MRHHIRPLTKSMILKLIQLRQIELLGKACSRKEIKYALWPLYQRGYVGIVKIVIDNREKQVVFTTPAGLSCLEFIRTQYKEMQLL